MDFKDFGNIKDIVIISLLGYLAYRVYNAFKTGEPILPGSINIPGINVYTPPKEDKRWLPGKNNKRLSDYERYGEIYQQPNGLIYYTPDGKTKTAIPYEKQTEEGKQIMNEIDQKYSASDINWNDPNAMNQYLKQTGWLK